MGERTPLFWMGIHPSGSRRAARRASHANGGSRMKYWSVNSTVPIAVERALYWDANSEFWSAGTDATGTALLP